MDLNLEPHLCTEPFHQAPEHILNTLGGSLNILVLLSLSKDQGPRYENWHKLLFLLFLQIHISSLYKQLWTIQKWTYKNLKNEYNIYLKIWQLSKKYNNNYVYHEKRSSLYVSREAFFLQTSGKTGWSVKTMQLEHSSVNVLKALLKLTWLLKYILSLKKVFELHYLHEAWHDTHGDQSPACRIRSLVTPCHP